MDAIHATVQRGRVEVRAPDDWPDGTQVEIRPVSRRPQGVGSAQAASGNGTRLKYETTADDLIAFSHYIARHSPAFKNTKWFVTLLAGAPALGIALLVEPGPEASRLGMVICGAILALLTFCLFDPYSRWLSARKIRDLPVLGAKRKKMRHLRLWKAWKTPCFCT